MVGVYLILHVFQDSKIWSISTIFPLPNLGRFTCTSPFCYCWWFPHHIGTNPILSIPIKSRIFWNLAKSLISSILTSSWLISHHFGVKSKSVQRLWLIFQKQPQQSSFSIDSNSGHQLVHKWTRPSHSRLNGWIPKRIPHFRS